MANFTITTIRGDGIGPEIVNETLKVINCVGEKYGHTFKYHDALLGGAAIDATGVPLPEDTLKICRDSDAVLLGAVGGAKWDTLPGHLRPEAGLLGIRKGLGLFANLRPVKFLDGISNSSPIKDDIIKNTDIMIVRELLGGLYFGEKKRGTLSDGTPFASDNEIYTVPEVERIIKTALSIAAKRKKKLCSVDKANVMESSRFWREIAVREASLCPEIEISHMYVDNAAMQLINRPSQFDVIVTSNIFGDILSDEASVICGSLGMLPSASLAEGSFGLYEPAHGSAPDIAGRGIANPLATILSAAMMFRYSLNLSSEADNIESAVTKALDAGFKTADLQTSPHNQNILSSSDMTSAVISFI